MNITWQEVKKAKPKIIFYSSNTVWWTHDSNDLLKTESGLPIDCFGSPLFQIEASIFLDDKALVECGHYGKDPFKTIMLCHAQNIDWLRAHPNFSRTMKYKEVAKLIEECGI